MASFRSWLTHWCRPTTRSIRTFFRRTQPPVSRATLPQEFAILTWAASVSGRRRSSRSARERTNFVAAPETENGHFLLRRAFDKTCPRLQLGRNYFSIWRTFALLLAWSVLRCKELSIDMFIILLGQWSQRITCILHMNAKLLELQWGAKGLIVVFVEFQLIPQARVVRLDRAHREVSGTRRPCAGVVKTRRPKNHERKRKRNIRVRGRERGGERERERVEERGGIKHVADIAIFFSLQNEYIHQYVTAIG